MIEIPKVSPDRVTDTMAGMAVDDWFVKQSRNPFGMFYLYHKTGAIWITDREATLEGFTLSDPQRISPNWSRNQTFNHVRRIVPHLPIY